MISSVSCDTSGSVQDAACAGKLDDTGHTTEKLRLHPPLQRLDDAADMSGRLADRLGAFCKGASARDGATAMNSSNPSHCAMIIPSVT